MILWAFECGHSPQHTSRISWTPYWEGGQNTKITTDFFHTSLVFLSFHFPKTGYKIKLSWREDTIHFRREGTPATWSAQKYKPFLNTWRGGCTNLRSQLYCRIVGVLTFLVQANWEPIHQHWNRKCGGLRACGQESRLVVRRVLVFLWEALKCKRDR